MSANQDEANELAEKRHAETIAELQGIREEVKREPKPPTVLTRPQWEGLNPADQSAFIQRGGAVRDLTPEERTKQADDNRAAVREDAATVGRSVMLRSDWDQLGAGAQSKFIRDGGRLID
jgi:hypothetical protein